ncbi:MAG: hypothetical protein EPO24_08140 [Bacteroidetes bacterium]|nr:MAG: hypothetical protein EPO24_08140 [Bacteroidota bacterium]
MSCLRQAGAGITKQFYVLRMSSSVHIINSSSLSPDELEHVSRSVEAIIGARVHRSHLRVELERAFDSSRGQYNSSVLLAQLLSLKQSLPGKIIALVDVDLYVPVLTFVYGEAQLEGAAAIVSTHRLHNSFYGVDENRPLLIERVEKEIVHELGHTFGLFHCHQFECVMRSSTYVEEIDFKKATMCKECEGVLYRKVRGS